MDIKINPINKYNTEVIVDGKRIVLTSAKAKKHNSVLACKIRDAVIAIVIFIIIVVGLGLLLFHEFTKPVGYYAPDYVDENGVLYDIDGDGDTYHWVDP